MTRAVKTSDDKWKYSVIAGILFFIIANPTVYKFMDQLVNAVSANMFGRIAGAAGCPTMMGLIVHAVVYTLLIRALMDYK
jgi:hypothetical protein